MTGEKEYLGRAVAIGASWMVALRFSVKGIGLVSTLILVRILTPEDFGLVAIAMSFFALLELIAKFGFETVIIQKQNPSREHYDTAWSFNVLFGILACLLTICVSGQVAKFYEIQKLKPLLMVVSLLFIFNGLQNIGVVEFRKKLSFDKEFKLHIIPKLISSFTTIILVFWLKSYWALVIGTLILKGSTTILSYFMHPYRPKFTFVAWEELFNFSKWLMINNLLSFINSRSPEMIVAKIITPEAAGYFTISKEMSTLVTSEVASNVNSAAFPGYSKLSNEIGKLKVMYLDVMAFISFIVIPAGVGVASISGLFVPVVLGLQWIESIELVRYLAMGSLFFALNSNTGYVFLAIGQPKILSLLNLFRVSMFIPLLLCLTHYFGVVGAAGAVLITTISMFLIFSVFTCFKLKIKFSEIINIHFRPAFASFVMFIVVIIIQPVFILWFGGIGWGALSCCIIVGSITYSLCVYSLWVVAGRPASPEKRVVTFFSEKCLSVLW
jgi:lipopolysaccharide exporter